MSTKAKHNLSKKQKNKEYLSTLSTIKWKRDIGDEQLAKILQEGYSKENMYDVSECVNDEDDSDTGDVENTDDKIYWEKFDSVLKEFDPIPLYNGTSKHNVIDNKKFKSKNEHHTKTTLILDKMITNGVFDKITGVMTAGKEATIYNGCKEIVSSGTLTVKNYAVKVYKAIQPVVRWIYDDKTEKYKYIEKYPRNIKLAPSKGKKEMLYYQQMKRAKIPCPEVIASEEHIVVLSVIGGNKPAPSLQCAHTMNEYEKIKAYQQIVNTMKTLYNECNLIHGDLSIENILWYNHTCYFIDLGQSVESHEEQAFHLLFNDCRKISEYFSKFENNIPKFLTAEDLFLDITGYNYLNRYSLAQLQEIEMTRYKNKQA